MRRPVVVTVSLLAALVVAPLQQSPAQVVEAAATQLAIADWLFIRGDHGTSYLAIADRGAGGGTFSGAPDAGASVLLAKGRCDVIRRRRFTVVTCRGRGVWKEIPIQRFEVDPLLASAKVTVRARGFRNRVEWVGRGNAPQPASGATFGPGYLEAGAGFGRGARASGRIFGDRVRPRGGLFSFAGMLEGTFAIADAFADVQPGPDGSFSFTRRIRIPT